MSILTKFIVQITFILLLLLSSAQCGETNENIEIKRTLKFGDTHADGKKVILDNINGSVKVTGYNGETVEVIGHESIDAESNKKLEAAKNKVTVEFTEEDDRVIIFVNTPWRCDDGCNNYRGQDYYGYDVRIDFEIRVPVKSDIVIKTVNDGDIDIDNIIGSFIVENVNGAISMTNITGSGKAHTVNGDVEVRFKENPLSESSFMTVNGEVNIKFQENLSADLEFKTMNGEVYSDFDVKTMPIKPTKERRRNGKHVYSNNDSFSVRVGDGGPEISFNTLNGDITVSKEN